MDPSELKRRLERQMSEVTTFARRDVPLIIGVEAVNQFKASFDKEAEPGSTGNPWKEVERRKPDSPWYGHSGQTGKFSQSRTTAKILTGETGALKDAIRPRYEPGKVIISNDRPYAAVHNFGLRAKIYGKKPFTMPKRPFMLINDELMTKINTKIQSEITKILQK
jgi:phage virion morphogenesis protein